MRVDTRSQEKLCHFAQDIYCREPCQMSLCFAGFQKLADKYNVPSNPGQYLMLANSSGIGTNFSATPLNTALAQFFGAILNSHIFSVPVNLYANESVIRQFTVLLPPPLQMFQSCCCSCSWFCVCTVAYISFPRHLRSRSCFFARSKERQR